MNRPTRIDEYGNLRVWHSGRWRLTLEIECLYCGKKFITAKRGNHAVLCSVECQAKHHQKYWDKKRITKKCEICGITIKVPTNRRYRTCRRQYCVRELYRRLSTGNSKDKSLKL